MKKERIGLFGGTFAPLIRDIYTPPRQCLNAYPLTGLL